MNVKIRCECGENRHLGGILGETNNETNLSKRLSRDKTSFLCSGHRPWHNEKDPEGCGNQLKGSLRSASNVYYANTENAIFIPVGKSKQIQEILDLFKTNDVANILLEALEGESAVKIEQKFREKTATKELVSLFSSENLISAIEKFYSKDEVEPEVPLDDAGFRKMEYDVLKNAQNSHDLMVREGNLNLDSFKLLKPYIKKLNLVDRLRETRVFYGFSRITPENNLSKHQVIKQLFRRQTGDEWLPCYVVFGEGIFFEFDEKNLNNWASNPKVENRVQNIRDSINHFRSSKGLPAITSVEYPASYFMIHTFSHILINQLIFDCGYSSASLRERLYVSNDNANKMNGLLIYTAAGDSEGTMGGLVKMGAPGSIEETLLNSLSNSKWCSSDPICMEMGNSGGQGPNSCNLAACHNCCLLPETACENFNRYLDRALLIGTFDEPEIGFFSELLK